MSVHVMYVSVDISTINAYPSLPSFFHHEPIEHTVHVYIHTHIYTVRHADVHLSELVCIAQRALWQHDVCTFGMQ